MEQIFNITNLVIFISALWIVYLFCRDIFFWLVLGKKKGSRYPMSAKRKRKEQSNTSISEDPTESNQWVRKSIAGIFAGFVLFYFVIHCIDLYQLCYLRDYSQMQITEAEIVDVETNAYRAFYRFQTIEDSLNSSGKWFISHSEYTTGQFPRTDYITITEEEYEAFLANPKSSLCIRYVKNNPRINKPCSRTTPEHYKRILTIVLSCIVLIITCVSYIVKIFPVLPAVEEFFSR